MLCPTKQTRLGRKLPVLNARSADRVSVIVVTKLLYLLLKLFNFNIIRINMLSPLFEVFFVCLFARLLACLFLCLFLVCLLACSFMCFLASFILHFFHFFLSCLFVVVFLTVDWLWGFFVCYLFIWHARGVMSACELATHLLRAILVTVPVTVCFMACRPFPASPGPVCTTR